MLVVDTSAILAALATPEPDVGLVTRIGDDGDLHAPHLLDVEVLNALRGLVRAGKLHPDRADDVRHDVNALSITRYGHLPLADRAWELRENLTAYDAMWVALAEALGAALVTCDAKLARAPGVTVELYGAD